nr:MAG TPA: hypothetical protein [Crassvirales sp.]
MIWALSLIVLIILFWVVKISIDIKYLFREFERQYPQLFDPKDNETD